MPSIRPQWLPTVNGGCRSGCTCSCGGAGTMTYDYNADNQQTSMSDGADDTTNYAYNGDGQQTQVTDPLGNTTTNTYDAQGRLLSTTNALNGTVSYAYNLAGWQTSETDPDGNITQYAYNAAGELTSETNPLNDTQTFGYDAAGQLTSKTDYNGQETEYAYNESGWRTSETWLNSQNQAIYQATYSYDPAGRLTEEQDPNSIYDYSYNASGQLTQTEVTYPSLSTSTLMTLSYGYDSFGNRTSLSDSLGGSLTYSYNGEHQLTGETFALNGTTGPQLSLIYDTDKRLQSITRTDGSADTIVSNYSYDSAYRLTNMTYTDTTTTMTLASYSYGYNTASQVSSYQDANSSLTYSYDKTGQLTSASGTLNGSSYSGSWSYDANGNRTMSGYQTGAGNELLNDGTYTYTYDKNGNTLTKTNTATGDQWTYTWDYHNRLTEAVEKNSSGTLLNDLKYTYDVEGRLIGVEVNGTQQRWTVFDGANPYMDFNGSGTAVTERYVTNPSAYGTLYARVSGSGTADWYVTDRLGSVRLIVDTSGNVLDALVYDPWGNIVSESNPSNGDRFKYDGGQYDSIQQTELFTARWDNVQVGRWESRDPLDLRPDINPYRFVSNDPINVYDPSGLAPPPPAPKPPGGQIKPPTISQLKLNISAGALGFAKALVDISLPLPPSLILCGSVTIAARNFKFNTKNISTIILSKQAPPNPNAIAGKAIKEINQLLNNFNVSLTFQYDQASCPLIPGCPKAELLKGTIPSKPPGKGSIPFILPYPFQWNPSMLIITNLSFNYIIKYSLYVGF